MEGAVAGALAVAEHDFGLTAQEIQDVADRIPRGTSAAVVLFEHTWALRLKEYILDSGGMLIAQGLLHPSALVKVGVELAAAVEIEKALELEDAVEEEVEELELLHHRGTISEEEFEAKKKELLELIP